MKNNKLDINDIINLWMIPVHGKSIEQAYEESPWKNPRDFYGKYPVTQQQHDEWVIAAKKLIKAKSKYSMAYINRAWWSVSLNAAPNILEAKDYINNEISD